MFDKHNWVQGRLITGSKSWYRNNNPDNLVIFNSNVFAEGMGKIWYGDIDLTVDKDVLYDVAKELGVTVYVLYEIDGRFENENREDFKDVAVWNTETGLGNKYCKYYDHETLLRKNT